MHSSKPSPHLPIRALALTAALLAAAGSATAAGAATAAPQTSAKKPATTKPSAQPQGQQKADEKKPAITGAPPSIIAAAERSAKTPVIGPPQPPDGKWLVDDQGRQYFVQAVPRQEGLYKWLDEDHTKVRLAYGLTMDVVRFDDKNIYVKIYRAVDAEPAPAPRKAEDPQKVAATYKFDTPAVHRLSFQPFADGLPDHGQWRNGFVVADMNGDGHPDIVHCPVRKGGSRPVIYLGDGQGHWKQWQTTFPQLPFDYGDVAVADLNGDGKLDLVAASHLIGLAALLGDGKGNFTAWSQGIEIQMPGGHENQPAFSSRAIEIADWNRDGKPDILAAGEGPRLATSRDANDSFGRGSRGLRVYLNQGDGTWVAKDEKDPSFGDAIAHGDFNGDGRMDFVMGSSVLGYRTVVGYGEPDGSWKRATLEQVRSNAMVTAAAVADLDRDGRDDLVLAYLSNEGGAWRSGVDVFYSRPGDTWERRALYNAESRDGIYALGVGDLDNDGVKDVVGLTGAGGSLIFLGDGKGWFAREEMPLTKESGCRGYRVVLTDLDGDGRDEIVADFAGEGSTGNTAACESGGSLQAWKVESAGKPGKKAPAKPAPKTTRKGGN